MRLALVAGVLSVATLAACSGCSNSAAKESVSPPGEPIATTPAGGSPAKSDPANDARYRLAPDEGKLAIVAPGDAKAGGEAVAKITVTAGSAYKVNTEYPTK